MALPTDYARNKYLAVIFEKGSEYIEHPERIVSKVPALEYVGQIGAMPDAHLYGVALEAWATFDTEELSKLDGVATVEVQEPKMRAKRSELDL